jgi:hypothetical protein
MNGCDIRVIERGKDFRFALKTCEAFRISGERLRQDLDRYLAFQSCVTGAIDLPHAAFIQESQNFVSAETGAGRERHGEGGELYGGTIRRCAGRFRRFSNLYEQFLSFTGRPDERVIAVWENAGVEQYSVPHDSSFDTNRYESDFTGSELPSSVRVQSVVGEGSKGKGTIKQAFSSFPAVGEVRQVARGRRSNLHWRNAA